MVLFYFCHKMQFLVYRGYLMHIYIHNESQEKKKADLEVKHKISIEIMHSFTATKVSSLKLILASG